MTEVSKDELVLKMEVVKVLQTCFDPEIPVNIYDLGLIYDIEIHPENKIKILMTLTSPACPVAGTLPGEIETRVKAMTSVSDAEVEVVWEPPWNPEMMSEAAKLELNMF
ncbi:MAG: DUF59 domain-containing protein [Deferribacteres bacterium]|nr:DUF59 domain-containing protein [candidate division KSB1 bacterium]MCB9511980.1 DUF59 domain-containing protein [Deferribacteres bacterium]